MNLLERYRLLMKPAEPTPNLFVDPDITEYYYDSKGKLVKSSLGVLFEHKDIYIEAGKTYRYSWTDCGGTSTLSPSIRTVYKTLDGNFISRQVNTIDRTGPGHFDITIPSGMKLIDVRIDSETSPTGAYFSGVTLKEVYK